MNIFRNTKKEKGFTRTQNSTKSGFFNFFNNQKSRFKQNSSGRVNLVGGFTRTQILNFCEFFSLLKSKDNLNKKFVGGFTLIEVMISIGLFTVVMIVGITAILRVNNTYRKARTQRSAVDNLSFMMEDMARNMRLGSHYRCIDEVGALLNIEISLDGDCPGIAFEPFDSPATGDDDDQVVYFIEGDTMYKTTYGTLAINAEPNDPESFKPMNSIDLKINPALSGFTIYGSDLDSTDGIQPSVLIRINGTVRASGSETDFNLQTTVTQRLLDIQL